MAVLKARIGGAWVDVGGGGGSDEVFVGPSDPIASAPTTELWYDTDEPAALTDDLRWNTAWGVISHTEKPTDQMGITTGVVAVITSPTFTPVAGRRYRFVVDLTYGMSAAGSMMGVYLANVSAGVYVKRWLAISPSALSFNAFHMEWVNITSLTAATTFRVDASLQGGGGTLDIYGTAGLPPVSSPGTAPRFSSLSIIDDGPLAGAVPILGVTTRWDTAWGLVASAVTAGSQTLPTATAWHDVTGLSLTYTAIAGRRYKVSMIGQMQKITAAGEVYYRVTDAALNQLAGSAVNLATSANGSLSRSFVESPTPGVVTRKVQAYTTSLGLTLTPTNTYESTLTVEDVGPVGGAVPVASPAVPWIAPTLINGWVNFGAQYQVAQYRMIGDIVYVRGLIKSGTGGQAAFTLPAGYRPLADLYLPTTAYAGGAGSVLGVILIVASTGAFTIAEGGTNNFSINTQFSVSA